MRSATRPSSCRPGWSLTTLIVAAGLSYVCLRLVAYYSENGSLKHVTFSEDGSRLTLHSHSALEPQLKVYLSPEIDVPLLGKTTRQDSILLFEPSVPFQPGRNYFMSWLAPSGKELTKYHRFKSSLSVKPKVQFISGHGIPANALKFYLHFSQPMEQGVFLDRLRLLDADGKEVIGPFRETELWSPEEKRLTVWFHPGRQKTGVNLNEEEGPVLRENMKHTLVIAGSWRSTSGVALGGDVRFDFQVGPADHEMPMMEKWKITAPKSGTREPLIARLDEPLDPAMVTTALSVHRGAESVPVEIEVDGLNWRAIPAQPWTAGSYELRADPNLEDLAGNNLTKPFEVDVSVLPNTKTFLTKLPFEVR